MSPIFKCIRENKTNRNAEKAINPFTKPNNKKLFQINSSL